MTSKLPSLTSGPSPFSVFRVSQDRIFIDNTLPIIQTHRRKRRISVVDAPLPVPDPAAILENNIRTFTFHYSRRNYPSAIYLADQILKANPNHTEVLLKKAQMHRSMEDLSQAIAYLDRVVVLEPKNWEALSIRGGVFIQQGEYMKGLKDIKAAYTQCPTHFFVAYYLVANINCCIDRTPTFLADLENEMKNQLMDLKDFILLRGIYYARKRDFFHSYPDLYAYDDALFFFTRNTIHQLEPHFNNYRPEGTIPIAFLLNSTE
jgi:tetratricopeptide (TPR) repeat protein